MKNTPKQNNEATSSKPTKQIANEPMFETLPNLRTAKKNKHGQHGSSDSSDYQNTTNQVKQWSTNHQNPKIKFLLALMEWHSSSHSTNLRLRTLRCSSFCNLSRATCIIVVHGERKMQVPPMIHPDSCTSLHHPPHFFFLKSSNKRHTYVMFKS